MSIQIFCSFFKLDCFHYWFMIILLSIQIVLILYNNVQIFSLILCIMFSLFDVALWSRKACSSNAELIYLFSSLELLVSCLRTSHLIKVVKIYSIFLWISFRNIIHLSSFLCALWRRDPILFFSGWYPVFWHPLFWYLSKITDHKSEGLFTVLFYLYVYPYFSCVLSYHILFWLL